MKKLAFFHNGPLYYDSVNKSYYGISFNKNLLDRYFYLADQVTFVMRLKELNHFKTKRFSLIEDPNFKFTEVPDHLKVKQFFFNRKRRSIIEKEVLNADIVVARIPSGNGFLAIDYAKKHNIPYIVEAVSCPYDALWNHNWKGKILTPFIVKKMKSACAEAPYIIYVTKKFLQNRYPSNGEAISASNVELTSKFNEQVLFQKVSSLKGFSSKVFTIGTLANVDVPYKGQRYVLHAIKELKKQGYQITYRLAGAGTGKNLKGLIERLDLNENVVFEGILRHEEIDKWFEKLDIYVHPSDQEGLPRAVIEAMSSALPVIGSSTGGIPELLSTRMVFERKNVMELVKVLANLDSRLLEKEAKINFEKAKHYKLEILNNRRNAFYDDFLKRNGL